MSVIAWDGKDIAADKRGTSDSLKTTTSKLYDIAKLDITNEKGLYGYVGFVGNAPQGQALIHWLLKGAKPSKYPLFQSGETWTRLIFLDTSNPTKDVVKVYETTPYPLIVEDKYMAWGAGRDYALAAMYLGKTAEEAVQVAIQFDTSCGNGISTFIRTDA